MMERGFKVVLKKSATEDYEPSEFQQEAQEEIIESLMQSGYDEDDAVLILEAAMGLWEPSDNGDGEVYFDDDDEGGEVH